MKTYKRGISLIVFVITIIVLSILAVTLVANFDEDANIIDQASDTVFRSDMSNYQELLKVYIANKRIENPKFKKVL